MTRLDKGLMVVPFPEGFGASVHFAWPNKDYIPLGVYVHLYLLVYRSMHRVPRRSGGSGIRIMNQGC
jgi:hypothetical protein